MRKHKRVMILIAILVGLTAVSTLLVQSKTAVAQPNATTTILYDGSLNTGTPSTQSMLYLAFPTGPYESFDNGVTTLDTTADSNISAGYFGGDDTIILDRMEGYQLHFTVKIDSESHNNDNRAGFSIIALSSDVKGIELGFWQDEVWAQHDDTTGTLFTHGEGNAFNTTSGLISYELAIVSDTYTLSANDTPILTGPLRDYSNFAGFPDPYETPNLIFLGDDTTSAQALIQLSYVAVTVNTPTVEPTDFLYLPFVRK